MDVIKRNKPRRLKVNVAHRLSNLFPPFLFENSKKKKWWEILRELFFLLDQNRFCRLMTLIFIFRTDTDREKAVARTQFRYCHRTRNYLSKSYGSIESFIFRTLLISAAVHDTKWTRNKRINEILSDKSLTDNFFDFFLISNTFSCRSFFIVFTDAYLIESAQTKKRWKKTFPRFVVNIR